MYKGSEGAIVNDYDRSGANLKPGHLTAQQVQPVAVKIPAIGPNGENQGQNTVAIDYTPSGSQPDGTGKIFGITDPEGRAITLSYGVTAAARNEVAEIAGPGSRVVNAYVAGDEFTGRPAQSQTMRIPPATTETLSTATHMYAKGALETFGDFRAALESSVTLPVLQARWPGYLSAWVEHQQVETVTPSTTTVTHMYLDALGNAVGSRDEAGAWSFTLYDPEGRVTLIISPDGSKSDNTYYPERQTVDNGYRIQRAA